MLVDSHCHLNFPEFAADLEGVMARAAAAGVGLMQTICTDMAEFPGIYAIAERYSNVYCSVGVHPNESGNTSVVQAGLLQEKTCLAKVIGIGETGLDYHYAASDRESQMRSFIEHIVCAQETKIPLIVHSRDADEDTAATISYYMKKKHFTGVIHCFTSTKYLADIALENGFYISFSGILTFKNAHTLREIAKDVPLERLLIETDAPFLAPVPHRGKANEPAYIVHTHKLLSEIKGISEEACARATTENFFRLFTKAKHAHMLNNI